MPNATFMTQIFSMPQLTKGELADNAIWTVLVTMPMYVTNRSTILVLQTFQRLKTMKEMI
jgi:hypothetical protein